MAEIMVNFVVSKLADFLLKEALLLGGVGEQVKRMQRELIRIQCCLTDADSKRKGDARVQNWLNELRDVAYRIEDVIDTFFLRVEDRRPKNVKEKFFHKMYKLWQNPIEMPVLLHNLGTELGEIQKLLEEISKSRIDYGIQALEGKRSGEAIILPFRRTTYQQVDENEVVGLEADKNNILQLLRPEETPRRTVITIVGTGGLGKTTLAQFVYQSAREDFEYHIMLSISQQFSLIGLLKKIISKFNINYSALERERNEMAYYIDELKSFLSSRRYLIVLDDVWEVDLWNQLKHALPDVKNGSRILMTSRFINVAQSADPTMKPYEFKFLNDKESLDLLLKKALPYRETHEEFPTNLIEIAKELSKKCKGLPLALIVIGGILSTKDQSYTEWERVLRTMNWHSDGIECMKVLAMSYEDMPHYLKACFLYLAVFPEDYEINANRLIRIWVAEGFIPQQERKTMEETAEDCLKELIQRSMVQVSRRRANGSIKYCQVHDLLRDLAIHEAKQENFVTVFLIKPSFNQKKRINRRISLQSCKSSFTEYIDPNTRSYLWFGGYTPHFYDFKLLKVLEIEDSCVDPIVLQTLIHLKYLALPNHPNSKKLEIPDNSEKFTFSAHSLRNLETLLIPCHIQPEGLWTISTLRHVQCVSVSGPSSMAVDLRNLQTLKWVYARKSWLNELPRLDSLRELGLRNKLDNWDGVTNLLGTLPYLVSLGINGSSIPMKIFYPSVLPNYKNLQSLYLDGKCSENVTLVASLFPPHLVKLTLKWSNLRQDPMPELGKLKSLRKLCLEEAYWRQEIIFPAGFPVLQHLKVQTYFFIKELKIAAGVMPKLVYLEIPRGCNVQMPPELLLLTTINYKRSVL